MHRQINLIVFDLQAHEGADAGESAEQSAIAQAGVSGCLDRAQKLLNFAVPRCPSPSRRCFVSVTRSRSSAAEYLNIISDRTYAPVARARLRDA